jgi:hypothetical protein
MLTLLLLLHLAQIPELPGTPVPFSEMRILEIEPGTGAPARPGQQYTVHYTGWLRDGRKFDSSRDRNQPLQFIQGRRRVIAGWEAGFQGMRTGGKRRLFIPYQMAYGELGRGAIPPKAELIFDVELLAVTDVSPAVPAQDLMHPFETLASRLSTLLAAIPGDKLAWRPSPLSPSFGEIYNQLAGETEFLLWLAESERTLETEAERRAALGRERNTQATKTELTSRLNACLAAARKTLPELRQSVLDRETSVFGKPSTIRGYYILLNENLAIKLGQLIVYASLNGLTPP